MSEKHNEHGKKTALSVVNHLVANQGVLFVKLHQYHWHVQGPHFFSLHEKLEEMYNESNEYYDAFAERLITKGETPYSTLAEYLEHASISEKPYDKKMTAEEMIEDLVKDYRTIGNLAFEGSQLAAQEDDVVTEDMLNEYKGSLDKTIWMLQAYLGKDADEGESK